MSGGSETVPSSVVSGAIGWVWVVPGYYVVFIDYFVIVNKVTPRSSGGKSR